MASPFCWCRDRLVPARFPRCHGFGFARQAADCGEHGSEGYADAQANCADYQRPVVNHGFQRPLVWQAQVTGAFGQ